MKSIQTEIIINASAATVWNTLLDFNNYPKWNPFIHITGIAQVGEQLQNTIYLEGQKPQVFKPTVLVVADRQEFKWEGKLFVKGLFDGEHYFRLESINDNQARLVHGENFRGVLSTLLMKFIGAATKQGFIKMNEALKQQCETILIPA